MRGDAGENGYEQRGGGGVTGELGQEDDEGGDYENHQQRMRGGESGGHLLTQGFGCAGGLQQRAQADTAAEEHQHTPVGIAGDFFPLRHAEYDDGDSGNQGNDGIGVGNAERFFDFGAEYPSHGSRQENQQRDHAVQRPRNRLGFDFDAFVQIGLEDDVHGKQHQGQNQQHHRQAELHPADEVQIQGFGGNHVRR